jgi:hypothetical protein
MTSVYLIDVTETIAKRALERVKKMGSLDTYPDEHQIHFRDFLMEELEASRTSFAVTSGDQVSMVVISYLLEDEDGAPLERVSNFLHQFYPKASIVTR